MKDFKYETIFFGLESRLSENLSFEDAIQFELDSLIL
jgi:hypothetical protein